MDIVKIEQVRAESYRKIRVYICPSGEGVLENFANRRARPSKEYAKIMPEVLKQAGLEKENVTFNWSQRAGCSCGCSPGFILSKWGFSDIVVTVEGPRVDEKKLEQQPERAEMAARLARGEV